MTIGLVQFGWAWAEYGSSTPNAMDRPVLPIARADTPGIDYKLAEAKPEPFPVYCVIFGLTRAQVIARVTQWQAAQRSGLTGDLDLRNGTIPNCLLLRVRKMGEIQEPVASTNSATHMQELALQFIQTSETD